MTTTTTNWETVRHEGEVYKVLNDHAGTLTVTEWREQLEEYAEHICDKTGLELLKGIAPPCTPGHKIDKAALVGTISELFKRSTKKFCETWLQDEPGGTTTALATAGGIEFAMRTRAVTEDILRDALKCIGRAQPGAHTARPSLDGGPGTLPPPLAAPTTPCSSRDTARLDTR